MAYLFKSKHSNLASHQANRQTQHLWIVFVGALLFIPAYIMATFMYMRGWVTPLFAQTVIKCIVPYLLAAHLMYHSIQMPAAEQRILMLINFLLPYFLLVLVMGLLQQRYSRGAVLLVATLTTFWFWFSDRFIEKNDKLRLLYLDTQTVEELYAELGDQVIRLDRYVELVLWAGPQHDLPDCDGALVTFTHTLSNPQQLQLSLIKQKHIRLYSVAAITESLTGRKSPQELRNTLWQPDGNPSYDILKRFIDLTVVLITTPGWIPLALLTAAAVKLDSPGPALFSQMRTGLNGRPFRIWKFRTMALQVNTQAQFAQAYDKRITRIGKFLRKSRLDEIPQLFNVLLGHMSLIGPRPEQHSFVNQFSISIPSYPYRHLVRPGITGWAQVLQGYVDSEEQTAVKLSYDLYYVTHYSLALDFLILAKTVLTIITGRGAR